MTEGERVQLYNSLCDFRDELRLITIPSQTRNIHTLTQAIDFVHGTTIRWLSTEDTHDIFNGDRLVYRFPCTCSSCGFARGFSDFKLCPQCGGRAQRK